MQQPYRLAVFASSPRSLDELTHALLEGPDLDAAAVPADVPAGLHGAAWDLEGSDAAIDAVREGVRQATPEDAAALLIPHGLLGSRRSLVVTDVDSTLIEQEVIEMLAAHAGREAEVAAVTERAMRGELDFAQSLHHRVKALAGLPVSLIDEVAEQVIPTPGAQELIDAAHAGGHRVGAVSGGFIQVLEPLAARLGLDHAHANVLGVRDGVLTGEVVGPVVDRAAKAASLRRWCTADDVDPARTIGLGDGANDLDLLTVAGLGVGVQPKPALRAAADAVLGLRRLDLVSRALGWGTTA